MTELPLSPHKSLPQHDSQTEEEEEQSGREQPASEGETP